MNIAERIEHTCIDARATKADISNLCHEAKKYYFRSVCVNPEYSHLCKMKLHGTETKIVVVYNFPTSRSRETRYADEIDVLIQARQCLTKQGKRNIARQLEQAKKLRTIEGKPVKIVIETRVLTKKEIVYVSKMIAKYRLDYIKSSTGLYNRLYEQLYLQAKDKKAKALVGKMYSQDNFEDLKLIKQGLKIFGIIPRKWLGLYVPKIKISGGIKYYKDAIKLIEQGADLLGASKGVSMIIHQKTDEIVDRQEERTKE